MKETIFEIFCALLSVIIILVSIIFFIGFVKLIHSADIYYEKSAQYIDFKMNCKNRR